MLKVKYAFNLETLIYIGTRLSQITQIFVLDGWPTLNQHCFNVLCLLGRYHVFCAYLSALTLTCPFGYSLFVVRVVATVHFDHDGRSWGVNLTWN